MDSSGKVERGFIISASNISKLKTEKVKCTGALISQCRWWARAITLELWFTEQSQVTEWAFILPSWRPVLHYLGSAAWQNCKQTNPLWSIVITCLYAYTALKAIEAVARGINAVFMRKTPKCSGRFEKIADHLSRSECEPAFSLMGRNQAMTFGLTKYWKNFENLSIWVDNGTA